MKSKTHELVDKKNKAAHEAAVALEVLYALQHVDKKKLYAANFIRGMAFSVGGVVGATIVIALMAWFLSFFDTLPIVGQLVETIRETLQQ